MIEAIARALGIRSEPEARTEPEAARRGDDAYARAMSTSADLIEKLRKLNGTTEVARQVMSDVWDHRQNVPFLTTVYQAVQEGKSGIDPPKGPATPF